MLSFASAQGVEQLDEEYGFMGYRLESRKDSIRSLVKNGKQDHLRRFRPANPDSLYYRGIRLKNVSLWYFHGILHSIDIKTVEPSSKKMLAAVKKLYGDGEQNDMFGNEIAWYGEKVRLTYEFNPVSGIGLFSWTSKKMHVKYVTYMYDINNK